MGFKVACVTVKVTALEVAPPLGVTVTLVAPVVTLGTVQTTLVAFQEVAAAAVPLKLTVPEVPKLLPLMVKLLPTTPLVGDMELMLAVAGVYTRTSST
jgi:hypothetical protein